jgi:hypothetical protein
MTGAGIPYFGKHAKADHRRRVNTVQQFPSLVRIQHRGLARLHHMLRAADGVRRVGSESKILAERLDVALVRELDRRLCFPFSVSCQRLRAETGMPRPVIRLSTLHPTFASVR